MKLKLKRGTTGKIIRVFLQDSSKSDGSGLTGLLFNSSGLNCYYIKEGGTSATQVTLASGTVGTWSSGGFKEIDSTNLPGWYELGLPDAMLSTGNSTIGHLKGATNLVPCPFEIELDAVDYQDAIAFGLSRLDAAISGIATSVWAFGARTLTSYGTLVSDVATAVWGAASRTLTAFGLNVTVGGYAAGQDPATLVLDAANGVETSITPRMALRIMLAAMAGKISGADGTTVRIRNINDTKDVIVAEVDASGDRTSVTVDGS